LTPAPLDPFHERVARVALEVADQYGFVLGGGLALILHGALSRPTEDPALEDEDVARAGRRLDRTPDRVFPPYGLGPAEIGRLRARFAGWPR